MYCLISLAVCSHCERSRSSLLSTHVLGAETDYASRRRIQLVLDSWISNDWRGITGNPGKL